MNVDRFEALLPKLKIQNKLDKQLVPFHPNQSQLIYLSKMRELKEAGKPLWMICLKARQLGVSTVSEALLFAHCVAVPNAHAMILAHDFESSKELFSMAKRFRDCIPLTMDPGTQRQIRFPHSGGNSLMRVSTAGSGSSGRGMSFTALHLSEVAYYGGDAGILGSVLNAVAYTPDTIVIIESTANGKSGEGEAFYRMWVDAIEGRNAFLPVFIPWTMDSTYTQDAALFADGPRNEEEEDLVAMGLVPEQMAWRRWAIENKSQGSIELFHQEYPISWPQAFVSSGNPAFEAAELNWARKCVDKFGKEVTHLRFERDKSDGGIRFTKDTKEGVAIWEKPQKGYRYYIGCDVGRGGEGDDEYKGDFSSFVGWNGSTGEQAFRYDGRIGPEVLADLLDMVGRTYFNAMINVELTGGWGTWTQKVLRDTFHYSKLYRWKGSKDDAAPGRRHDNRPLGFDTTMYSRRLVFAAFREAHRDRRIVVKDEKLLIQMESATYLDNFSQWGVQRGHDDILMAALVGWLAAEQYPPPRKEMGSKILASESQRDQGSKIGYPDFDLDAMGRLSRHFKWVRKSKSGINRLDGI